MTHVQGISIVVQDLGKKFHREWIFKNLSFQFLPGKIYVITGPNGAGKSTLLQTLWGQLPPTKGTIEYHLNGKIIPGEEIFHYIQIATPYMELIEEFTLEEFLKFHFSLKSMTRAAHPDEWLEKMYLEDARHKLIGNFSSGMKQRLKLGLAFYSHADLLFFDEPGTNLDHRALGWYLSQLQHIAPSQTLFIASNHQEEYPENAEKIDISDFK